jgi:hypothetical protein
MKARLLGAMLAHFFALITIAMQPAFAVSSFETYATRDTASGTDSDPRGPATTGSLLSEVLLPFADGNDIFFSGQGFARGAADDTGAGAVGVDGVFSAESRPSISSPQPRS